MSTGIFDLDRVGGEGVTQQVRREHDRLTVAGAEDGFPVQQKPHARGDVDRREVSLRILEGIEEPVEEAMGAGIPRIERDGRERRPGRQPVVLGEHRGHGDEHAHRLAAE